MQAANVLQNSATQAAKQMACLELPTVKQEDFKYTYWGHLNWDDISKQKASGSVSASLLEGKQEGKLKGARFGKLVDNLDWVDQDVEFYLADPKVAQSRNRFSQLAATASEHTFFLDVEENSIFEKTVMLRQLLDSSHQRIIIRIRKGAQLTIFDLVESTVDAKFNSQILQIYVEAGAKLNWQSVNRSLPNAETVRNFYITQNQDSEVQWQEVAYGGNKTQSFLNVYMVQKGAQFHAQTAYRGHEKQNFDLVANYFHQASYTQSSLEAKMVMAGKSKSVFNGLIQVENQALYCEASQKGKGLLLSKEASIHAMPKLIVAIDEVQCAHGAAISDIPPEQLYYLETRGLTPQQATEFIVNSYTDPLVQKLDPNWQQLVLDDLSKLGLE